MANTWQASSHAAGCCTPAQRGFASNVIKGGSHLCAPITACATGRPYGRARPSTPRPATSGSAASFAHLEPSPDGLQEVGLERGDGGWDGPEVEPGEVDVAVEARCGESAGDDARREALGGEPGDERDAEAGSDEGEDDRE